MKLILIRIRICKNTYLVIFNILYINIWIIIGYLLKIKYYLIIYIFYHYLFNHLNINKLVFIILHFNLKIYIR